MATIEALEAQAAEIDAAEAAPMRALADARASLP